jgi:hypothetical protein
MIPDARAICIDWNYCESFGTIVFGRWASLGLNDFDDRTLAVEQTVFQAIPIALQLRDKAISEFRMQCPNQAARWACLPRSSSLTVVMDQNPQNERISASFRAAFHEENLFFGHS